MFDADLYNVDENGEVGNISVSLGQETRVSSTLKFSLPAKLLNKMVKLSEKVGVTYLHAFRENIQLAPSCPLLAQAGGGDGIQGILADKHPKGLRRNARS